jgi:hypothetical protein
MTKVEEKMLDLTARGVTANKLTMCGIQISIDTPKPGHIASNKGATKLTLRFFPRPCAAARSHV